MELEYRMRFNQLKDGRYSGIIDIYPNTDSFTIIHESNIDYSSLDPEKKPQYRFLSQEIHRDLNWNKTCQTLYERYLCDEIFWMAMHNNQIYEVSVNGENITIGNTTIRIDQLDSYIDLISGRVAKGILNRLKQVL